MNKKLNWKKIFLVIIIFTFFTTTVFAMQNNKYSDSNGNIVIKKDLLDYNENFFIGNDVNISTSSDAAIFVFGANVTLDGTYNGDVIVFGQNVRLKGDFSENVYSFAQNVETAGNIEGNLYSFSQKISLDALVNNDAFIFSSALNLNEDSSIERDLFFNGNTINIYGNIGRNLKISSDSLYLDSSIGGNIDSSVNDFKIGDKGKVEGEILNRGLNDFDISNNAELNFDPIWEKQVPVENNQYFVRETPVQKIIKVLKYICGFLLVWLFLKFFTPNYYSRASFYTSKKFLESFALGVASVLVCIIFIPLILLFISPTISFGFLIIYLVILFIFSTRISVATISSFIAEKLKIDKFIGELISVCIISFILAINSYFTIPFFNTIFLIANIILGISGVGFLIYNLLYSRKLFLEGEKVKVNDIIIANNPNIDNKENSIVNGDFVINNKDDSEENKNN